MVSGNPYANRREARKLGLLHKQQFRRFTRAKVAAGSSEHVCGECPTRMLILMNNPGLMQELLDATFHFFVSEEPVKINEST
jgi:hypothetical protein